MTSHEFLVSQSKYDVIDSLIFRFRQYYLEGGWGYVVLLCALVSGLITSGLQLSVGLLAEDVSNQFRLDGDLFGFGVPLEGRVSFFMAQHFIDFFICC